MLFRMNLKNLTKKERQSINKLNLKKDDDLFIFPADKGRATVILDKKENEGRWF